MVGKNVAYVDIQMCDKKEGLTVIARGPEEEQSGPHRL